MKRSTITANSKTEYVLRILFLGSYRPMESKKDAAVLAVGYSVCAILWTVVFGRLTPRQAYQALTHHRRAAAVEHFLATDPFLNDTWLDDTWHEDQAREHQYGTSL